MTQILKLEVTLKPFSHKFLLPVASLISEEFEATNNTVELRLHLAPSYRLEGGALQPLSKGVAASNALSFDRRKTVGDLRLAIYQVTRFSKKTCLLRSKNGVKSRSE